ncbi:NADP-dependent 3-hydroxy acid dehydrogenase YdfG [Dyadobacter sp. SG02]|uniref:SDR family oxidoreductase n=1 Tax=Dyadobacter sp. SG02 TaxID=1855291 RepID=UPI0008B5A918|nr:SDR family oxidoreductase [Dyadobacter sp. SG02]SEJ04537.1 NADP-dependent 3-hydroxy acid dehydrogenase YdfG [Dyadobacter sp. SG02]
MMSKTILITGASSGIGKAAALHFAENGWNVVATMRNPEKETNLADRDNILVTRLDVQVPATIESAISAGIARFGAIDAVVNNAGYGQYGVFEAITPEQVQTQFDVNVFGVMHTIRAILPHFRERGEGMIINISSGAGRFTLPLISLYNASKFALEGFSEALSFELAALNITVKIVEPGGTTTNFIKTSEEQYAGKAIPDYDPFIGAAFKMFDNLKGMQLATAEEVAATIFAAATDGTDTLRYLIGNEDFKQRVNNRLSLPDQEYIESIKRAYLQYMK